MEDDSKRTPHIDVAVTQPGVMNYTAYVEKSCHCASDFMITANDREVERKTVPFSKRC